MYVYVRIYVYVCMYVCMYVHLGGRASEDMPRCQFPESSLIARSLLPGFIGSYFGLAWAS